MRGRDVGDVLGKRTIKGVVDGFCVDPRGRGLKDAALSDSVKSFASPDSLSDFSTAHHTSLFTSRRASSMDRRVTAETIIAKI